MSLVMLLGDATDILREILARSQLGPASTKGTKGSLSTFDAPCSKVPLAFQTTNVRTYTGPYVCTCFDVCHLDGQWNFEQGALKVDKDSLVPFVDGDHGTCPRHNTPGQRYNRKLCKTPPS